MEPKKQIDIVISTWNREWMTETCIRAIKKNTVTPFRLIIVDNGSLHDAQLKYLDNSDIYVKLDKNYGLEHAKWVGMQFVESPLFVSTDNDILPYSYEQPDWLQRLIDLMERCPEYGAIALRPQVLVGTSPAMFELEQDVVEFPHVPGYCRIMRTDWVNEVGAWKDKRPLRGHEEMWIGEKFAEKGYKMGWARNVRCWHLWGKEDEDMWGYRNTESGHNPVWPIYHNDLEEIRKGVGIEI